MASVKLNMSDSIYLRDFLRYEDLNVESLLEKIENIFKMKNATYCFDLKGQINAYLSCHEYLTLKEISEFIESLEIDETVCKK